MVSLSTLVVIAAASAGQVTLLDFTGPNCVHCRTMEPTVERLKAAGYPVQEIDISRSPAWAQKFRVRGIPAFILVADGKVMDRQDGATTYERLEGMFRTAGYQPSESGTVRSQSPASRGFGLPLPNFLKRRKENGDNLSEPPPNQPSFLENRSLEPPPAARTASFDRPEPSTPPTTSPTSSPRSSYTTAASDNVAADASGSPERTAGQATVRLKVEDSRGYSFGTGTIIDIHNDEALILTCGHIFRDSKGKGKITVDLFADGAPRRIPGQLISYDADRTDLGLVSIRPNAKITPAPVAPREFPLNAGMTVFSIGCNNGRPPTLQRSKVTAIDRYQGPSNIEVAGMPVSGRSGGGLFTSDGMLIGVCNAADRHDNEGIYAALPTIQAALTKIGQSRIFERSGQVASSSNSPANTATAAVAASSRGDVRPVSYNAAASDSQSNDLEIICIVRPRGNPDAPTQSFTLVSPSDALLRQLKKEAQSTPTGSNNSPRSDSIIRAQSN